MTSMDAAGTSRPPNASLTGSYVLRHLLDNIPLSAEGNDESIEITCVEFWEGNLYIGTSAGEILHFFSIPGETQDGPAELILASRLQPLSSPASSTSQAVRGVQQILLLPRVNKACILCNSTLTFYSLPELTPAMNNQRLSNCTWVGGLDLNLGNNAGATEEIVMICLQDIMRLVRISERAKGLKVIEYPGCLISARRGRFACVADSHSYALLDVENQQKIPLFPISSLDEGSGPSLGGSPEDNSPTPGSRTARSSSSAHRPAHLSGSEGPGHNRSTSLGTFMESIASRQGNSRSRSRERLSQRNIESGPGTLAPTPTSVQAHSPTRNAPQLDVAEGKSLTPNVHIPPRSDSLARKKLPPIPAVLQPHIVSPVSTEFLLTTGTLPDEPGVGIFVNCDGDVVRGTLEFSQYPQAIVLDGGGRSMNDSQTLDEDDRDGYILASLKRLTTDGEEPGIEIQRWDVDTGEGREWLAVNDGSSFSIAKNETAKINTARVGIGVSHMTVDITFAEVGKKIRARRLNLLLKDGTNADTQNKRHLARVIEDWEVIMNKQEDEFTRRLGQETTRVIVWTAASLKWAVRNPQVLKFDAMLDSITKVQGGSKLDHSHIISMMESIRHSEAKTETEFLGLQYIRQKISMILFLDLFMIDAWAIDKASEDHLLEGNLDPRVPLSMIPLLHSDIFEGPKGIWIHAGLIDLIETRRAALTGKHGPSHSTSNNFLNLIKQYLTVWRQRKGFGSIADEAEVFSTVDAALLHILLHQDRTGHPVAKAELYAIVDHEVACFDRMVALLEEYQRLYILSRLYQSKRMSEKVLTTWKRIIEGERDEGGEFTEGENEVCIYLTRIKNAQLFEDYATWLASRNPTLGVQVFTDDNSRVRLPPNQVVQLLKLKAPDAVKVYLEHLVFGKKNVQYANDLISYYLDNVLAVLTSSGEARSMLSQSYESYRALHPPKPTYRQFIIDNAVPDSWWHDRLRVLELLGGSHGAGFSYDVSRILERIEPFEQDLVPESIILDGRQGRHQQALRLLTHGLGDYHTAINYCLLGGSSIFHPTSGPVDPQTIPSREEQAILFHHLFIEFLRIEDENDRFERTSELLARFGSWFDIAYVLEQIPDSWSVELVSAFIVSAIRRLLAEKSEAMVAKALSGAENIRISADFAEKCEAFGAKIETA
ncbi:MAG: hypothetical protein MMC33_010246 [Icmadophila ericetorum]|nr:hypothetical protein [Icmadophila ericetorum]